MVSKEEINEQIAEKHKVEYVDSNGEHHFKVVSGTTGNEYNVSFKCNCDCQRFSVYGAANGWGCTHIFAVLKKLVGEKKIKFGGNK